MTRRKSPLSAAELEQRLAGVQANVFATISQRRATAILRQKIIGVQVFALFVAFCSGMLSAELETLRLLYG